jgi:hypothetical protein
MTYNKSHNTFASQKEKNIPGSITSKLGRGEDAKNSLLFLTLRWAFIIGLLITLFIVINHWLFRVDEVIPNFMNDIKTAWDIILPIITLALGYAFGRSHQ